MGILFTMAMGFLFTITMGILLTIPLGIQFTISRYQISVRFLMAEPLPVRLDFR